MLPRPLRDFFPILLCALVAAAAGAQAASAQAAAAAPSPLFLSLVSGAYASDQKLSIETVGPQMGVHYSFRDPDGGEGPWIPYPGTCFPHGCAG